MTEKRYRIAWRAIKTQATGHGTGTFPKAEADRIAAGLNEDNKGVTHHWAEEVKE